MSSNYFTFEQTQAFEAHAALKAGECVTIGTTVGKNGIAKTANPTDGGSIAGVVASDVATAAGMPVGVILEVGKIVPVKVSAAVAVGADITVGVDRLGKTAASGNVVSFKALQAGVQNQIIACLFIGGYTKA